MAIFGPKASVNDFGKMSSFRLFKLLVFIAYNGVFSLYNTEKELFRNYILQKKKVRIMAIFEPKPWFNPFGKMSIFRHFELLVSIA